MKITLKQLKQIIKEEVGMVGSPDPSRGPGGFDGGGDSEQVMARLDQEINALVQAISVELSALRGDSEMDADAFIPELDGAIRLAVENVIKEFE